MSADGGLRPEVDAAPRARVAAARGLAYFAFWLVLMPSLKPGDLALGLVAAAGATWVSLRLLPPVCGGLRFGALLKRVPHFLWESVRAGVDVARRALSPSLPLNPGFVSCPMEFPPGFARNTFATISSLLPGSVPAGDGDEALIYHALDLSQPVVEQLREEERRFAGALVAGQRHG